MNGDELKTWRTGNGLYQADLADRLTAAGVAVDGVKLDQPTISEMERGKIEVPEAVAVAISGGLIQPGDRQPRARPNDRKQRKPAATAPTAPEAPPEPTPEPEPSPEPAGPEDETEQLPGQPADRPPTPRGAVPAVAFSPEVRSQLEADLRKLFAGDTFLVPIEVGAPDADGGREIAYQEAQIPGLAQIIGAVDEYDGQIIEMNASSMARAWADLAAENPRVRRFLMALTYGGAWRGVMATTLPVVYAIAVHHGLVPPVLGGAGAAPPPRQPAEDEQPQPEPAPQP